TGTRRPNAGCPQTSISASWLVACSCPGHGTKHNKEDDDGPEAKHAEPGERVEGQEPRAEEARRAAAEHRERRLVVGRVADWGRRAGSEPGLGLRSLSVLPEHHSGPRVTRPHARASRHERRPQ